MSLIVSSKCNSLFYSCLLADGDKAVPSDIAGTPSLSRIESFRSGTVRLFGCGVQLSKHGSFGAGRNPIHQFLRCTSHCEGTIQGGSCSGDAGHAKRRLKWAASMADGNQAESADAESASTHRKSGRCSSSRKRLPPAFESAFLEICVIS